MQPLPLLILALVAFAFAQTPDPVAVQDSVVDTVYVVQDDGIPWNRDNFDPDRLVRHQTLDPALSVAYTYSVSFLSTPRGSLGQNSFLAHLAYEFTPDLHLYADLGIWMPLHTTFQDGPFSKEDIRQGKAEFVLPAMALEYKPTSNSYIRFVLVNENDARKAYGPLLYPSCYWRNSIFCR